MRFDVNAGTENGWHGYLCHLCEADLLDWLKRPPTGARSLEVQPIAPIPRSRHQ